MVGVARQASAIDPFQVCVVAPERGDAPADGATREVGESGVVIVNAAARGADGVCLEVGRQVVRGELVELEHRRFGNKGRSTGNEQKQRQALQTGLLRGAAVERMVYESRGTVKVRYSRTRQLRIGV